MAVLETVDVSADVPRETVFLDTVIIPACDWLSTRSGRDMGDDKARVLMLAIALHESGLIHRRQLGSSGKPMNYFGRGWWQFEREGGVKGVLTHPASKCLAKAACELAFVPPVPTRGVHEAIAWHDWLAAVFARLLLWTDMLPLPEADDTGESYEYYERNWRPGKPRASVWTISHTKALARVREAGT